MTNKTKARIRDFGLALLGALAGYMMAGCDGGAGGAGGGSFVDSPACAKSSTVHVISLDQHFATSTDESNYIVTRALLLCEGWSAGTHYPTNPGTGASCTQQLMAMGLLQPQAAAECAHVMTSEECTDVQHDFVDAAGVKHAFEASSELRGFGLLLDPSKNATICTPVGAGEICLNGC